MDKIEVQESLDREVKDLVSHCPHCGGKTHFRMLFNDSYTDTYGDVIYYITFRCVPCKKLVLKTLIFKQNRSKDAEDLSLDGWGNKFPSTQLVYLEKFKETVPEDVLEDVKEGVISLNNKCYRASVSMFRRSLQSSLLNLGASSADDLVSQIKNMGTLTQDIKDWAHNVRIFGNWGAHPQDDNLKEVDGRVADEVRMFVEEFFNYVYVMPDRVAKARNVSKPVMEDK